LVLGGAFGFTGELLLLALCDVGSLWFPLGGAGATAVLSAVVALRPSAGSIRMFQMVMLLMIVSGGVGMYLHLRANMEFQLEMDATLSGFALFKKSIVAKAPPALAPGSMTQLGLIGLAYTFRHPALGARREI
jgi:hypothetical protein